MTQEYFGVNHMQTTISVTERNKLREEVKQLIVELVSQKQVLDLQYRPYQDRIDGIEKQKEEALRDLLEQHDSISSLITLKTREFNLGNQSGGGLKTIASEQAEIDRTWLLRYYNHHPDSFLSQCLKKKSESAAFVLSKPTFDTPLVMGTPTTFQQKTDHNCAILEARTLRQHGYAMVDTEMTGLGSFDEAVSIGIMTKYIKLLFPGKTYCSNNQGSSGHSWDFQRGRGYCPNIRRSYTVDRSNNCWSPFSGL